MNHIAPLCNPSFSFVLEAIGFPIWFCMLFVCKGVEAMCTKHLRISSALRSPLAISFRSRETRDPDPWRGSCWHCWPSWRSGKEWNETWFFSLMLRVILEFWRIDRYMSHFFHIHSICSAFFQWSYLERQVCAGIPSNNYRHGAQQGSSRCIRTTKSITTTPNAGARRQKDARKMKHLQ